MRKLVYAGLMGLAGLVGCEDAEKKKIEEVKVQEARSAISVAHYNLLNIKSCLAIATGDMNGDGRQDIIVTASDYINDFGWGTAGIYVFLNNGNGSYTPQTPPIKVEAEKKD